MARYAANLLLEYGVVEAPAARPLCERRIVVLTAISTRAAILKAKQLGRAAQQRYRNADGQRVFVRFVGLIDCWRSWKTDQGIAVLLTEN